MADATLQTESSKSTQSPIVEPFEVNLAGRLKKVRSRDALLPLFEAVINSVHAIEEKSAGRRSILVEILRAPNQIELEVGQIVPVSGFVITDSGIGFTDENLHSFRTTDSSYKQRRGGKGIGRLCWLKFFGEVSVSSVFRRDENFYKREFYFTETGLNSPLLTESTEQQSGTTVRLEKLKAPYANTLPKQAETIAEKLIEHFLSYFVTGMPISIELVDGTQRFDLKALYEELFGKRKDSGELEIRGIKFNYYGLKANKRIVAGHSILLCGNNRAAERILLQQYDPMLGVATRLLGADQKPFWYLLFVQSAYLDEIVSDDYDNFLFAPERDELAIHEKEIKRSQLIEPLLSVARKSLGEALEQKMRENTDRVNRYIRDVAPHFRYVAARNPHRVELIARESNSEIDAELRRMQFEHENAAREDTKRVIEILDDQNLTQDEISSKTTQLVHTLDEIGKSGLCQYIAQRKIILGILEKRMARSDGKHQKEEAIHELIFPLRKTSDQVKAEHQNLWIIDDRLAYHEYLASDKPIKSSPAGSESLKEPDILIFNVPVALRRSGSEGVHQAIDIIEFKKPGRNDYSDGDNPVLQIQEYIEKIRSGKAFDNSGNKVDIGPTTFFNCFIVADIEPTLRKVLERQDFFDTPDGFGKYRYLVSHKAFIQVISYNKLLQDAAKRNRILFDKLMI